MWQKLKKFIKKMRHPFGHWKVATGSGVYVAPDSGMYRVENWEGAKMKVLKFGETLCHHGNSTNAPCEPCDIEANRSGAI